MITGTYTVTCDGCGKKLMDGRRVAKFASGLMAEGAAGNMGWERKDTYRMLCPDCTPENVKEPTWT